MPFAERALDGPWGLLATEVREAVCFPRILLVEHLFAAEEPEDAFVERRSSVRVRHFQHAVIVLEQRHTIEVVDEPGADRGFGGRRFGVCVATAMVQRRGMRRRIGLVDKRAHGHGGAGALDSGRAARSQRIRHQALGKRVVKMYEPRRNVRKLDPAVNLRRYVTVEPCCERHAGAGAGGVWPWRGTGQPQARSRIIGDKCPAVQDRCTRQPRRTITHSWGGSATTFAVRPASSLIQVGDSDAKTRVE